MNRFVFLIAIMLFAAIPLQPSHAQELEETEPSVEYIESNNTLNLAKAPLDLSQGSVQVPTVTGAPLPRLNFVNSEHAPLINDGQE